MGATNSRASILVLPDDLLWEVFRRLPPREIGRATRVSRRFRAVLQPFIDRYTLTIARPFEATKRVTVRLSKKYVVYVSGSTVSFGGENPISYNYTLSTDHPAVAVWIDDHRLTWIRGIRHPIRFGYPPSKIKIVVFTPPE